MILSARTYLAKRPQDPTALGYLARAYLARDGDVPEVREYASRALAAKGGAAKPDGGAAFPDVLGAELRAFLAGKAEAERDWPVAEPHWRAALLASSSGANANNRARSPAARGLARAVLRQGRAGEAQRVLEEQLQADPKDAEGHAALGELRLDQLADPEGACESLRLAIKLASPRPPKEWPRLLARAYERLDRFEEACRAYEEAIRFAPDDPEPCVALIFWGGVRRGGPSGLYRVGRSRCRRRRSLLDLCVQHSCVHT